MYIYIYIIHTHYVSQFHHWDPGLIRLARAVRLRPEFKEMWALMKGLTESGETLSLGKSIIFPMGIVIWGVNIYIYIYNDNKNKNNNIE